jgi:phage tail protein X
MPNYTAEDSSYKTIQGDMWDIVSLREYGDEHAMNYVQDANFDQRFTDMFPASVILQIPPTATVQYNLKPSKPTPDLKNLLPWR